MKVGDKVTHIDYPNRPGVVVAKTKRYPGELQTFLVKWDGSISLSRHIDSALEKQK